jgi:hypothetical protein
MKNTTETDAIIFQHERHPFFCAILDGKENTG